MHNKKNQSQVLKTLKYLNLVNEKNIEVFSKHTRDNNKLKVFKDKKSGIIFIDDYYVGINEYRDGKYKAKLVPKIETTKRIFEENIDSIRRVNKYAQFVADKDICDFGCGSGEFLKRIQPYANKIYGVEPQNDLNIKLNDNKIKCYHSINEFNKLIDAFFLFHSFEQFNVINGSNVYFANPDGIVNILTRITGNNISEIFGTLGVDGESQPEGIEY